MKDLSARPESFASTLKRLSEQKLEESFNAMLSDIEQICVSTANDGYTNLTYQFKRTYSAPYGDRLKQWLDSKGLVYNNFSSSPDGKFGHAYSLLVISW